MAPAFPAWLHILAWASLGLALFCSAVIIIDEITPPQKMWIMAKVDQPEFRFLMQIARLCGFVTCYPVNGILLEVGVTKEM